VVLSRLMIRMILVLCIFLISLTPIACSKRSVVVMDQTRPGFSRSIDMTLSLSAFRDAAFYGASMGWLIASEGRELLRTEDGGENWLCIKVDRLKSISFCDAVNGWAIDEEANIWSSTDSGLSWSKIARLEPEEPLFLQDQITFRDSSHGWVQDLFSVWRTENGGTDWERIPIPSISKEFKGLSQSHFISPDTGWASGVGNKLYKTQDGGKSWVSQLLPTDSTLTALQFIDKETGWIAVSEEGVDDQTATIYRTHNGGESWQLQFRFPRTVMSWVEFTSANDGWVVGEMVIEGDKTPYESHGVILQTRDGGNNWEHIENGINEAFFSRVHFATASDGWLIASGNVYRTVDAGRDWQVVLQRQALRSGKAD